MLQRDHAITTSRNSISAFKKHLLHGLVWGESTVCLGIHFFWIMAKGAPLSAESTSGAVVLLGGPLAIVLAIALLMRIRSFKESMMQIEWLLHFSAALSFVVLLAYMTFHDPFHPLLPYPAPFVLWSIAVGFLVLANMTTHECHGCPAEKMRGVHCLLFGFVLWMLLLAIVSGMTWPPYFWTFAAVFHGIMAAIASKSRFSPEERLRVLPKTPVRIAHGFEALLLASLIFLTQLRPFFASIDTGTLELKYVDTLVTFVSPWFIAGVALALIAIRFRITVLTHIVMTGIIVFCPLDLLWPNYLALGYGLAAIFRTMGRLGGFGFTVISSLMCLLWVLGYLAFSISGLIFTFGIGLELVKQIIASGRIAASVLLVIWLLLAVYALRVRNMAFPSEEAVKRSGPARLLYPAVACLMLFPAALVLCFGGWYPTPIERAPRVAIAEPCGICHAGYSGSDEEYRILHRLGVSIVRVDFAWSGIQPADGAWDFTRWDNFLDAAEKNNMKVLALLNFDNNAVEKSAAGSKRNVYIAPEDIPLFLEYVRRTVARYKDRVYAWEIWNEADVPRFWQGTQDEFYELARRTAEEVRKTCPSARLLGTAMTGPIGVWTTPMIEGLYTSGAMEKTDHPACHLYIPDPRAYYNEYSKIAAAAKQHGHPGAPWITETGDPDGGTYFWRVSSDLLAEHVIKSHTIALSFGFEKIVWFCFRDSSIQSQIENPGNSEGFFGLLEAGGQWKPAAFAYRLMSEFCSKSAIRDDLVRLNGGLAARQLRTALYRRENGESALVLWLEPALRPGATARVTLNLGDTEGTPMLHDITSPYAKHLLDDVIDVSEKPVFITYSAKNPDAQVTLNVRSSPVDSLWLLSLMAMLAWVFIASLGRNSSRLEVN